MILVKYISKIFILNAIRIFFIVASIIVLIDTFEHVRKYTDKGAGFLDCVYMAILRTPHFMQEAMPIILVMASLTTFLGLARSSELVVVRASGVSALRILLSPVLATIIFGILAIVVLNPISAIGQQLHDKIAEKYSNDGNNFLSISEDGIWLRQNIDDQNSIISAHRTNASGDILYGVTLFEFNKTGTVERRIIATQAKLGDHKWQLSNGKIWNINDQTQNPEESAEYFDAQTIVTNLTPENILESFATPESIPFWQLPKFIKQLDKSGLSSLRHRVYLAMELAKPILYIAMVLIGASFSMTHTRMANVGLSVTIAIFCGFAAFFLSDLARTFGIAGEVPVWVSAWSTPIAAILMSLGLLLHLEDG